MMERRFCKALDGLWQRRHKYSAATDIIDEALEAAEQYINGYGQSQGRAVWFGRLSPDLRILGMSGPPMECFGLGASELCGQPLGEFTTGANIELIREAVAQSVSTGRMTEAFIRDREGKMMVIHLKPAVRQGQVEILAFAHYASYRVYQREPRLVGEA